MESLTELDHEAGSAYLLRDLIRERLGLALRSHNGIELVISKFAGRVKQRDCKSFLEYCNLLMSNGPSAEDEWRHVTAVLVTHKSGFWRHIGVVRTLADIAIPRLLSASPPEPLRIWSTSCSTGEEPLSIAMALKEAGWLSRASIEIHASDVSPAVIDCAMLGLYSEERIGGLDRGLRDTYFKQEQNGWRAAPELRELIRWKVANLMSESDVATLARSHVVFCRNVFIYFTEPAIRKTLALLARGMPAGAYLFSDRGDFFTDLVSSTNLFDPLEIAGSGVWIRRDVDARASSER